MIVVSLFPVINVVDRDRNFRCWLIKKCFESHRVSLPTIHYTSCRVSGNSWSRGQANLFSVIKILIQRGTQSHNILPSRSTRKYVLCKLFVFRLRQISSALEIVYRARRFSARKFTVRILQSSA